MSHESHNIIRRIAASFTVMLLALLFLMPQEPIQAGSCGDLTSYSAPVLTSVTQIDTGLDLVWEGIDDARFSNYVILASQNDSSPETGINGYLIKLSNNQTTGYSIDDSMGYTLGDFTSFTKNTSYYFAVGVEFDCGYTTTSNVIQATFPDTTPPELITPVLNATWGDKGIILRWNPIDHEYLQDIRVVASKIDPNPSYPDNGYVATLNTSDSTYTVNNSSTYSESDVTWFEKDQWYYFALTAKYEVNGKEYYVTSDSKRLLYEGPSGAASTYLQAPSIAVAKSTENGFEISWTASTDPRLTGYAIVVAKDSTPIYPNGGYLEILDSTATSYTINNSKTYVNGNFGGWFEYGEYYNFAVVALYGDDYRMSTSFKHKYIGPLPSDTSDFIDLSIRRDGDYYIADWTKINDSRLAAMYFVIDEKDENPVFSTEAWYAEVKDSRGAFTNNVTSFKFHKNSFIRNGILEQLEEGKTYNAALTIVLRDGTSFTSDSASFTFDTNSDVENSLEILDDNTSVSTDEVVLREKQAVTSIDKGILSTVRGRVLLQVESNGEGWYVDPVTENKFYLKDPKTAFEALRNFGLGISNADLAKIPIGLEDRFTDIDTDGDGLSDKLEEGLGTNPAVADTDGDGFADGDEVKGNYNPLGSGSLSYDNDLVNKLVGRIVLQVEAQGQAWYINPADGKRYYMKDGDAAFDIMRFLSLGISNADLRKIAVGVL